MLKQTRYARDRMSNTQSASAIAPMPTKSAMKPSYCCRRPHPRRICLRRHVRAWTLRAPERLVDLAHDVHPSETDVSPLSRFHLRQLSPPSRPITPYFDALKHSGEHSGSSAFRRLHGVFRALRHLARSPFICLSWQTRRLQQQLRNTRRWERATSPSLRAFGFHPVQRNAEWMAYEAISP